MSDLKKILSQALEEVWNKGDVSAIKKYYHPDFIMHMGANEGPTVSFKELEEDVLGMKEAFPDFHEVVHDLICEADQVVARLTLRGTQEADYMGMASKGKHFEVGSVDVYRFCGDKIIEQWGVLDAASMLGQLS